jgi:hypothetical protein
VNGNRRSGAGFLRFGLELRFQEEVRRMLPDTRRQALAWLRRKPGRPERVFWEILPTGERRRL